MKQANKLKFYHLQIQKNIIEYLIAIDRRMIRLLIKQIKLRQKICITICLQQFLKQILKFYIKQFIQISRRLMLILRGVSRISLFILRRQILLILILFSCLFSEIVAQSVEYIYNPLPIVSTDISKYGRELISIQFVQLRSELAFLSFEYEGIYIIDYQNNDELLASKQLNITQVQLVDFNIFALTQDLGMVLMYFNQAQNEIIVTGTFNPTEYIINTFFITQDQNYIILGVNCQVKVTKIVQSALNQIIVSSTNFLQEITTSGLQCLSSSNHIFANNVAIILSSIRDGVHLFYFKDIENPTYVKTLVKICSDVQQTYIMQNQPILFTLSNYYEVVLINLGDKFKNQDPSFQNFDETKLDYFSIDQTGGSKTYNYMLIDDEEQYMYLGVRTNGIVVYDLTYLLIPDVQAPIVVQELKSLGLANWISFAPSLLPVREKYDYLFLSDGSGFKIFQKVPINLNSNIINLYNSDNCIFYGYTTDQWPWSVVTYSDNNQYFAISSGYAGMYTFFLDQYGQLYTIQEQIKRYGESHDGILYLKNRKVIVLGQSGQGMAFYNATNPQKLTYINEFKLIDKQNDCDDITTDKQERYLACANGFQGLYILQVDDFMNPILWAEGDLILQKNGVESVIVDDQLKFGFYAVREEGIGAFQIIKNNGANTIEQTKYFATLGAEYLRFHINSDQTLVLVADGYQGLTIIDCKDYLNPILIKSIPVQGWSVKFTQLQANPSTVIVTQMEKGQISVIDISTIQDATKISALQFGSESAFGIASHPSNKFIIFTLSQGMRICNTVNSIRMHTQINRQSTFSSSYLPPVPLRSLSSSEKLYIGENVQLIMAPYYIQRNVKLNQIYYYHNYQPEQLPSWITFKQYQSAICLVPNLDALNTNQGFNILLIQVLIPIYPTDFKMRIAGNPPQVIVNDEQSQRIFNKLIQVGLLYDDGYVSDFFQAQMKLDVDWYKDDAERQQYKDLNDPILQQIKRIFTRAQFKYPIQFLVNGSLKFNYIKDENQLPLIQSFSQVITIQMNILKEKVQFVKQKFDGIIFSYSSNQQIFSIQGDIQQLNAYLNTKIIIFDPKQEYSSKLAGISIQINVTDNINNPLTSQQDISVYNFIKKKKQITLMQTFQSQYENEYPGGLTAQESFTIIIDKSYIQIEQDLTVNLQVLIQSGDQWININNASDVWISFDDFQLKGIPPLDSFNKKLELKIVVSDGYSENSQFLQIKVEKFPIKQIMIIVAILVSIIILFLILFIFRKNIHFIIFQKYHSHQQEILYCGEIYQKKIVFAPSVYEQTLKIFNLLFKSFNDQEQDIEDDSKQKKIQAFISNYRSTNLMNNYDEFLKDAFQIYQNNIKQFSSIPENEFKYSDTRIKIALKSYLAKFILNNNSQMLKIYKSLKKYTRNQQDGYYFDWYKSYVEEIQNLHFTPKNFSINTSLNQQSSLNESENKPVFGQLDIKTIELQNALEQILDQNDVNLEYDFYILTEAIKADYYGFDYQTKPRVWRSSLGEVIHSQIHNINPLSVYRKIELEGDKNSFLNKLRQIFWTNYKWIGSYKQNLPEWLGYEMFDNLMILSGIPKKQHQGEYKVLIYNQYGYVSQSIDFMIKQKFKKQNLEKSLYQQDSPNLNQKRALDQNQINIGNNLNSSLHFNLNLNNFMSEKFNYNSPLNFINKRVSQYSKQNSKGFFSRFNNDENINQLKIKSNYGIQDLNSNNIFGNVDIQQQRQMTEYQKEYESVNSFSTNQFNENGQSHQRQTSVPQTSQLKIPNQQIITPYLLSPPISQSNRENISIFHSQNNLRKLSNHLLKILLLENKQNLNQVNQYNPPAIVQNQLDYFLVSDDESYIFISSGSYFIILDIKNKLQLVEKRVDLINPIFGKFPNQSYSTIWITQVGSFVFLSNQKGHLNVLQISSDFASFSFIVQLTAYGYNSKQSIFLRSLGVVYSLSRNYGIYIIDVSFLLSDNPDITGFIAKTNTTSPNILKYNLNIQFIIQSPDQKYILLVVRSQGVYVYDVSQNPYNPPFAQEIKSPRIVINLSFFLGKMHFILLSDGEGLAIFEQIAKVKNSIYDYYNILNTDSCVPVKPFKDEKWPWFIINSKDDNFIAVSGGLYGLNIYEISDENISNPILIFQQNINPSQNDRTYALIYLEQRDLLIVGQSKQGTIIYDVKNFTNPLLKKLYKLDEEINEHTDYQSNINQTLVAICSFRSIVILDLTNIDDPSANLRVLAKYDIPQNDLIQRSISSISFNEQFTYGFYAIREYGVFAFKIIQSNSNTQFYYSIQVFKSFYSRGSQYVQYDLNQKYVFVSDGNGGVALIEVVNPDNPKIVQRISINGWVIKTYQPTINQNLLFINQMEQGQLSLIDISDRLNPVKIAEVQYGNENSFSTVTNRLPNRYYYAFTVEQGFRICPNNQKIQFILSTHTQQTQNFNLNQNSDDFKRFINLYGGNEQDDNNQLSQKDQVLNINQVFIQDQVKMILSPIYYSHKVMLNNLFFYQNFQIQKIPSWISFDSSTMQINLIPSYTSLDQNQDTVTLLLQIITQVTPEMIKSSMVTLNQATQLIDTLIEIGIVDEQNYFKPSNEGIYYAVPAIKQVFGMLPQYEIILQQVIYNLKKVQFIYPITLQIISSLVLNSDPKNSKVPFITTFSNNIQLELQFVSQSSSSLEFFVEFVSVQYTEIVVQILNNNKTLKVKSDKDSLNNQIQKGFIYGVKNSNNFNIDDIVAIFIVNDGVNKPVNTTFKLLSCPYLLQLQPLQLSSTTTLQQQYSQQYPNDLTVEDPFTIHFTPTIFINQSSQQLSFSAYLLQDVEWIKLEKNSSVWISFDPITLTLKGEKHFQDLFKSYTIKICASDNFTQIEDSFTLYFKQLSIVMIFIVAFVGFIFFTIIIGFYFCRHSIHKYWKFKEISYKEITVNAKALIKKSIVLAPHTQFNLDLMVKYLIQNAKEVLKNQNRGKSPSKTQVKQYVVSKYTDSQTGEILLLDLSSDAKSFYYKNPFQFKNLNGLEISQLDSRINIALFCVISNWALETDQNTKKAFKFLKNYARNKIETCDWYLYYLSVTDFRQVDHSTNNSRTTGSSDQEYPPMYQILEIDEDNFDQVLEIIKENQRKQIQQSELKTKVLENAIISQYYGYKEGLKATNRKVNFGQTMYLQMNQLNQVLVRQKEDDLAQKNVFLSHFSFIKKFREAFLMNFKRINLKNANKQNTNLPKWLNYELCDNNIIFIMKPQLKDIGEYLVEIQNNSKYTFYIFKIIVRGFPRQNIQLDKSANHLNLELANENLNINQQVNNSLEIINQQDHKMSAFNKQQAVQYVQDSPKSQNFQTIQQFINEKPVAQSIQIQNLSNNIFIKQLTAITQQ
ncbi:hypothetical protein ABPG72_000649 [Tetrahymena utriculariae]